MGTTSSERHFGAGLLLLNPKGCGRLLSDSRPAFHILSRFVYSETILSRHFVCAWRTLFPLCNRSHVSGVANCDLRVIGITGSVGKSTTKEMIAEVLSTRYRTLKSPGNLNNEIGLPLTVVEV